MKILVLCLPAIGDGLMATPMIKTLREKFPKAKIDVACMMGGVQYVFKNNPYVDNVYYLSIYSKNWIQGIWQTLSLRRKKYDISFLTFPSYRKEYHLVQAVIGAKKRIAHSFSTGYWLELNFLNTDLVAVDEASHNVINNLNLIYALNIDWKAQIKESLIKYDLKLDAQYIKFGKKYIEKLGWLKNKIIGIHPGSTNSPAALLRRWPIANYAKVGKYLIKKGYKIIVFIGPEEKEFSNLFINIIGKKNCILTNNKFNEDLGVLSQIRLLICNDNGFGHLANALGTRIITLWASTNDKLSLPFNKGLVTLIRPSKFVPWYNYMLKRRIPKGTSGGMEMISVKEVIEETGKVLLGHKEHE